MECEQPLGYIPRLNQKFIPVIFEGNEVGNILLYNVENDDNLYAYQLFTPEFNELIINHNNELRFSEVSRDVDSVTVWRVD